MKKGIAWALVLCLCVSLLIGCTGPDVEPSANAPTDTTPAPTTAPTTQPTEGSDDPERPPEDNHDPIGPPENNDDGTPYRPEGITYEPLEVPAKYKWPCEQKGAIETLTYEVISEYDPAVKARKAAKVYLPYGYDESKQYNIVYLIHGAGGSHAEWFGAPGITEIIDNMIYLGEIEPLIIVTPTFYYADGFCSEANGQKDTSYDYFAKEIREVLVPLVETKYSTYAGGDVSDANLVATRDHRGLGGLSMGSKHTLECGVLTNLDLFAWYGSFSGVFTPEAVDISAALHSEAFDQYPIRYLFVANGTADYSYKGHIQTMLELEEIDDKLTYGENFSINIFEDAAHDWFNWAMALYRFLPLIFS